MLLLKVLPYREEQWRYLVFNSLTGKVERIDAIGLACIQLPEDHGIIFPGGYHLQNGEYRTFEQSMRPRFRRAPVRSPNGEDVQYVFYHPEQGRNVPRSPTTWINRQLQNPPVRPWLRAPGGRAHGDLRRQGGAPTRIHRCRFGDAVLHRGYRGPPNRRVFSGGSQCRAGAGVSDLFCAGRSRPRRLSTRLAACQNTQAPVRRLPLAPRQRPTGRPGAAVARSGGDRRAGARRVREGRKYFRRQSAQADGRRGERRTRRALRRLSCPSAGTGCSSSSTGSTASPSSVVSAVHPRAPLHRRGATLDAMEAELLAAHERVAAATATFLASELGPRTLAGAPAEPRWRGAESRDRGPARRAAGGPGGDGRRPRHAVLAEWLAAHRRRDPADPHHRVDLGDHARLNQAKRARRAAAQGTRFERDRGPVRRPVQTLRPGHHQRPGPGPETPSAATSNLSRLLVQLEELES
ncbi:DNA repair ATPase [Pseudomonas aeruginosa]